MTSTLPIRKSGGGRAAQRWLAHPLRALGETVRWDLSDRIPAWVAEEPGSFTPALDLRESAHKLVLSMDVPGVSSRDLDIKLDGQHLTISGIRLPERLRSGEHSRIDERSSGSFVREIRLPHDIDCAAVRAELADGVLTVVLPKRSTRHGPTHG